MKKISLLIGTLGGATAGYVMSNKKLREQLSKATDAEEAARMLGKHLQKDGKKLAKHVKEFVDSEEVQENITVAKEFARRKVADAKREIKTMSRKSASSAKKGAKKAATKAKKKAKTVAKVVAKKGKAIGRGAASPRRTAKKATKKVVKKTPSKAKKTKRPVKASVRKVSK